MGKSAAKQPNGKYAVWSTVVDSFTVYDQTRDEAWAFWRDECGVRCADDKLKGADLDYPPYTRRKGTGCERWSDGLATMVERGGPDGNEGDDWHGLDATREFVREALADSTELCKAWAAWLDDIEIEWHYDDEGRVDGSSYDYPDAPEATQ